MSGAPNWGEDSPSCLGRPCLCASGGRQATIISCWGCGGADLPSTAPLNRPCPWCGSCQGSSCASCGVVVHVRGVCRWNHGMHRACQPSADLPQLCPDCWWHWSRQIVENPRWRQRVVPLTSDLQTHVASSVQQCQEGAGSQQRCPTTLRLRAARKWLLKRLLQGQHTLQSLVSQLQSEHPEASPHWCVEVLHKASRALCSEGRATFTDPRLALVPQR